MPVTPAGSLSIPVLRLRDRITGLTAFQTLTGSADAEEAEAYVFVSALFVDLQESGNLPDFFAMIGYGSAFETRNIGTGPADTFADMGSLYLYFNQRIPTEYASASEAQDAYFTFLNAVGGLIDALVAVPYLTNTLRIQSITMDSPVMISSPSEEGISKTASGTNVYRYDVEFEVVYGWGG